MMSASHIFKYIFFTAVFFTFHNLQVLAAPSILAESAILINARTGGVIFEKMQMCGAPRPA